MSELLEFKTNTQALQSLGEIRQRRFQKEVIVLTGALNAQVQLSQAAEQALHAKNEALEHVIDELDALTHIKANTLLALQQHKALCVDDQRVAHEAYKNEQNKETTIAKELEIKTAQWVRSQQRDSKLKEYSDKRISQLLKTEELRAQTDADEIHLAGSGSGLVS